MLAAHWLVALRRCDFYNLFGGIIREKDSGIVTCCRGLGANAVGSDSGKAK